MGLGSNWGQVLEILEQIIPVYDRVNSFISLGKDREFREQGIRGRVNKGDAVLDAGSGFGNMSKTAMQLCDDQVRISLYDPLRPMLKNTGRLFSKPPSLTCGVFEHIPFRDENFDAVLCGYSLRDAISLRTAISEIHRVLKNGGRFVIVDLGKPDNTLIRAGVTFYLRAILPILALLVGGRLGLKFAALYDTYKVWPQNKVLKSLLLEKFARVEFDTGMMGGAVIIAAYK
ncbi:MAG TPA: class I SAM-dependent methyltransferase [Candidatus Nitrosotalea sp.]|nr:class I SAM-dependent methyltransferase [Candidatus Nitrosotalea sp.]